MDRVLTDLTKIYPHLKKITLIGHSAGAQFVDRYSALGPLVGNVSEVTLRFAAVAPSSVLYPSQLRPEVDKEGGLSFAIPSAVPGYDDYPYGLGPSPLFERLLGHPVVDRTPLVKRLLERNIVFAVGTQDTTSEYLDRSRSANTQGPNRYVRLQDFVAFVQSKYHASSHRLLPIAGVGHNSQRLIRSAAMSEFFSER